MNSRTLNVQGFTLSLSSNSFAVSAAPEVVSVPLPKRPQRKKQTKKKTSAEVEVETSIAPPEVTSPEPTPAIVEPTIETTTSAQVTAPEEPVTNNNNNNSIEGLSDYALKRSMCSVENIKKIESLFTPRFSGIRDEDFRAHFAPICLAILQMEEQKYQNFSNGMQQRISEKKISWQYLDFRQLSAKHSKNDIENAYKTLEQVRMNLHHLTPEQRKQLYYLTAKFSY